MVEVGGSHDIQGKPWHLCVPSHTVRGRISVVVLNRMPLILLLNVRTWAEKVHVTEVGFGSLSLLEAAHHLDEARLYLYRGFPESDQL